MARPSRRPTPGGGKGRPSPAAAGKRKVDDYEEEDQGRPQEASTKKRNPKQQQHREKQGSIMTNKKTKPTKIQHRDPSKPDRPPKQPAAEETLGARGARKKGSVDSSSESESDSSSDSSSSSDEAVGASTRNPAETSKTPSAKGKDVENEEDSSSASEEESPPSSEEEEEDSGEGSAREANDKDDEAEESSDDEGEKRDSDSDEEAQRPGFSDQNASWLKPKKGPKAALLESDDDEGSEGDEDDDGGSDDDDLLEVEREARLMDQEREDEIMEADDEMRHTIRHHTSVYHLPTQQELDRNVDRVVPPGELKGHIESILEVLTEFRERREPGRARKEYLDVLGTFLAELHGYLPELIQYYLTMLGPAETVEFVAQSDKPRPLVIRTNTLKTRRKDLAAALMKRGVSLDPLASWSKVGLTIAESPVPIGATPEYLSGHYMLQSAASMCAVVALSPQPNDKVLDVSAAPGGKTTYLSQLMRNTGVVVANDLKAERQKATVANVHRLGVRNVVACQHDGRKLGALFRNRFDRVLLDAPCSGLGVASRDPSVKVQRTLADVHKCAHLQKELLLSAIDALKFRGTSGGLMVYSTCSVSVAENEEVVQYALAKRDVKIVDAGLDVGRPGFTRFQERRFHPTMALTRRFYPHVHNMDGFFVAKIQKLSDGRPGLVGPSAENDEAGIDIEAPADDAADGDDASGEKAAAKVQPARSSDASKIKNKNRKRKNHDKAESDMPKKAKNPAVSVPPSKPKGAKPRKQNAKVNKPRRSRAATDA